MNWQEGPRKKGCVYHKQNVHDLKGDSLVIDVFIMPSIVTTRPIAITLGRYRNFKPVYKEKGQIQDPDHLVPIEAEVPRLSANLGVDGEDAKMYATEVRRFLEDEAPVLRRTLRGLHIL